MRRLILFNIVHNFYLFHDSKPKFINEYGGKNISTAAGKINKFFVTILPWSATVFHKI